VKVTFLAIGMFSLCACAVPAEVRIPEIPHLPVAWGDYDLMRYPNSECPIISGDYIDTPEIAKISIDGVRFLDGDSGAIYGLFPQHLAEQSVNPVQKISDDERFLSINQDSASRFNLRRVLPNGKAIVEETLSLEEGDFSCSNGIMKFPQFKHYGMIEGQSMNFQVQVQIRKTRDGALVLIWSRGLYRSNSSKAQKNFIHRFHRFSPR